MKSRFVIVLFFTARIELQALASMMFDVTFEDPPHVLGTYTATGAPPLYPSSGSAFVDNVPGFTSQVGLVGGILAFQSSVSFTSLIHILSWDFMNLSVSTYGSGPDAAFFINSAGPDYDFYLAHGPGGEGVSLNVQGTWVYEGPYSISNLASYAFTIDFDSRNYSFSIDGINILSAMPLPSTMTSLDNVSFEKPGNNSYAIDNFRWEIIPEPTTNLLLTIGGAGLAAKYFNERHKKKKE